MSMTAKVKTQVDLLKLLIEKGKLCAVSWQDAARQAQYRGSAEEFLEMIKAGSDDGHETARLVFVKWNDLIKEKQKQLEATKGDSPKSTAPTRTEKVVEKCISETVGLTESQREVIRAAHNEHRKDYGALPLEYDLRLEKHAQAWANFIAKRYADGHIPTHNPVVTVDGLPGEIGENIAHGRGTEQAQHPHVPDHAAFVEKWINDESKNYDMAKKAPKPKPGGKADEVMMTGHFTQVIWKSTSRVGCGFVLAHLQGGEFIRIWVCNYHPAGNYPGQHAKNVGS